MELRPLVCKRVKTGQGEIHKAGRGMLLGVFVLRLYTAAVMEIHEVLARHGGGFPLMRLFYQQ